jgi:hypothetical protein
VRGHVILKVDPSGPEKLELIILTLTNRLTALTEKLIYTEAGSMVPEDHRQHVKYGLANIRQFQVSHTNNVTTTECFTDLGKLNLLLGSRNLHVCPAASQNDGQF